MSDVFISYSRRDSAYMQKLHDRLAADDTDVWVDWEDIPATADWWAEIKSAIEAADTFAFLITPNSIRSDVCRDEIQHAVDNNKRFIPLLIQPIDNDVNTSLVHPAIKSHNWITFTGMLENDAAFERAFEKLKQALSTEPAYIRRHTRLLVRAKEWEANNRSSSYLLKGAELSEFQEWQQQSQTRDPKPTDLHYDYILASQSARNRGQLRVAIMVACAMVVLAILSGVALFQQQRIADGNQQSTAAAAARFAQETQIANLQENARANATNIVIQANAQNTQAALQGQVIALQSTINALAPANAATPTSQMAVESTATALMALATETAIISTDVPTATATPTASEEIIRETEDTTDNESSDLTPTDSSMPTAVAQSVDTTATAEAFATEQALAIQETQAIIVDLQATSTAIAANNATVVAYATETAIAISETADDSPTAAPTLTDIPVGNAIPTEELTITYVVQQGDFLVDIASRFGTTVIDILEDNNIPNGSIIFAGQQLTITYTLEFGADDTLHVASSTGQDNSQCGTAEAPCATITAALRIADQDPSMTEIRIAPGVYNEPLEIVSDVALVGTGIENTILTGDFTSRIVLTRDDTEVFIVGMTISGGNANWGSGITNNGELSLVNVRLSGNVASMVGGGVANFGTLTLTYTDFADNFAPYYADIYNTIEGTLIQGEQVSFEPETVLPEVSNNNGNGLALGALVDVVTTDGSNLNLRDRASTNGRQIGQFPAGTPLLIIGGPQRNNGFRWWEVQTAEGITGWVVDQVDGDATIGWLNANP